MRRQGSIKAEDREFVETWESITPSNYDVIKIDSRGEEQHEIINGQRTFFITSEERIITQGKIRDPKNDPFLNGSFRPVIVPDSVTVESNPNALSDDEIRSILVSSDIAWNEWMEALTSADTLKRMIDIANADQSVSLKRFRDLETKHASVKPKKRVSQKDSKEYESIGNPTTRASSGGRSS